MKKTEKISRQELVKMLLDWKFGSQPANVQYVVSAKNINKYGKAKFGQITKIAAVGCMIGHNHENSVNLAKIREGFEPDFKSEPLWKGKGIHINAQLVEHIDTKDQYLFYKYQQTFKSFYFDADLNPVKRNDLKEFFYDSTPKNQGVENKVYSQTLKIENIRKIKMRKMTYIIE